MQPGLKHHGTQYVEVLFLDLWLMSITNTLMANVKIIWLEEIPDFMAKAWK